VLRECETARSRATSSLCSPGISRGRSSRRSRFTERRVRAEPQVRSRASGEQKLVTNLPGGDGTVIAVPLVPLHPAIVVHVVFATRLAERLAKHLILLKVTDGIQQVAGQTLDATAVDFLVRDFVQVVSVHLTRL